MSNNEAQQIIDLATNINNALEAERNLWRSKLRVEQKEREKMREGWAKEKEKNIVLQAENERLRKILVTYQIQFNAAMKATSLGLCKKAIKHALDDEKKE